MVMKKFEQLLGLPSLEGVDVKKIIEMLEVLDRKKLGEIKATAAAVKKLVEDAKDLSQNAPDLDKVMEMLTLVRGMHEEGSLAEARRLLREISKIVGSLPKEGVEAITALAQELKEGKNKDERS